MNAKHWIEGLTRRTLLGTVGMSLLATACGGVGTDTRADGDVDDGGLGTGGQGGSPGAGGGAPPGAGAGGGGGQGGAASAQGGAGGSAPLICTETSGNIEGPYYRLNAPMLTDLTTASMPGTRLTVSGRVLSPDCVPIAGAVVDVWQANDEGRYDNDGIDDPADNAYVLRGQIVAASNGDYSFRTIVPGQYPLGSTYRPAHIHVKVSAPGYQTLTTQLYFEGDPFNASDSFILDSLIMKITNVGNEKSASFDFVLMAGS